ncbi:pyridoxamine 5'-phosphate oxidase [Halobacteriales archaeon SW_8_65_20]|nr:MAG: pyridoxamine 5'-phosphate oxidase [Halobacteriales archaeon SW_8_65_20]
MATLRRGMTDHETRAAAMDDAAVDAFLREQGTGVLSLAEDGAAYAVPVSFGYDTGRALFGFYTFGEESRKRQFAATTDRACLTVYDTDDETDWKSVLAFGPLAELSQESWDEVGELISENAWTPDLSAVGSRRLSVTAYELDIEEVTGLHGDGE